MAHVLESLDMWANWRDLPDNKVVIAVVDQRGNTAIRVVLGELWGLLLALLEVKEHGLVS